MADATGRRRYDPNLATWRSPDGLIHAMDDYSTACLVHFVRRPVHKSARDVRVVNCLACVAKMGFADADDGDDP